MATQRLLVVAIAGDAARAIETLWRGWMSYHPPRAAEVDHFCRQLRANGAALPVIYFCEWVDRWLMGDQVPGPQAVRGEQFEAACFSAEQALDWTNRCSGQFSEPQWLASRLREAVEAWEALAKPRMIVMVREVLGASTTDEEVHAALRGIPAWLSGVPGGVE